MRENTRAEFCQVTCKKTRAHSGRAHTMTEGWELKLVATDMARRLPFGPAGLGWVETRLARCGNVTHSRCVSVLGRPTRSRNIYHTAHTFMLCKTRFICVILSRFDFSNSA